MNIQSAKVRMGMYHCTTDADPPLRQARNASCSTLSRTARTFVLNGSHPRTNKSPTNPDASGLN